MEAEHWGSVGISYKKMSKLISKLNFPKFLIFSIITFRIFLFYITQNLIQPQLLLVITMKTFSYYSCFISFVYLIVKSWLTHESIFHLMGEQKKKAPNIMFLFLFINYRRKRYGFRITCKCIIKESYHETSAFELVIRARKISSQWTFCSPDITQKYGTWTVHNIFLQLCVKNWIFYCLTIKWWGLIFCNRKDLKEQSWSFCSISVEFQ